MLPALYHTVQQTHCHAMLLAHLAHCDTVQQTHCHTVLQVVCHAVQQALSGVPGWDGETEGLGVLGGGGG